jgi:hypothetical protein
VLTTGTSHNITHNISKNCTKKIYRFWDIADLGFWHFYFSCENYQELAQARITKVVGFFNTNPTRLVLQFSEFSTIIYGFYKIPQNSNTIWESLLHRVPGKFQILTNTPLVYENLPERMGSPQLGPSPWPVAVMAKIRRGGSGGRWGEVGKMFRNSPATDLWAWLVEKGGRGWTETANQRGGSEWEPIKILLQELDLRPKVTSKDLYTNLPRSRSHNGPTDPGNKLEQA